MQTSDQAIDAVERYSPAEERFNRRRRTVGLWLAPAVLLVLLALPMPLTVAGHRMAAIMALVVVLWMTEALPMAVTAMRSSMPMPIRLGGVPTGVAIPPTDAPKEVRSIKPSANCRTECREVSSRGATRIR